MNPIFALIGIASLVACFMAPGFWFSAIFFVAFIAYFDMAVG